MKNFFCSRRRNSCILTTAAAGAATTLAPAILASPIVVTPATPPTASFGGGAAATALVDLNNDGVDDFQLGGTHFIASTTVDASAFIFGKPRGPNIADGVNLVRATKSGDALRELKGTSYRVGTSFTGTRLGLLRAVFKTSGGASTTNGVWLGGAAFGDTNGYLGVEFKASDGLHYGWIKLSVRTDANGYPDGVRAISWAYESKSGTPLHVTSLTAVPEVSANAVGLGALALGAAGVQALRRKRAGSGR